MKLISVSLPLLFLLCCALATKHNHNVHAKTAKSPPAPSPPPAAGEEESIEDVDEDKIDEIVEEGDQNLVIIFCKLCFIWAHQAWIHKGW